MIISLGFLCGYIYFEDEFKMYFTIFYIIYAVFSILPVLFIFISYFETNRGNEYVISNKGILRRQGDKETFYPKEDFKEIETVIARAKETDYRRFPIHFTNYNFVIVSMHDKRRIVLSCLLSGKLDTILQKHFSDIPRTTTAVIIPYISTDFSELR